MVERRIVKFHPRASSSLVLTFSDDSFGLLFGIKVLLKKVSEKEILNKIQICEPFLNAICVFDHLF